MKKTIYLMVFAMGLLVAGSSVMLSGCTKEGPQGIAGKDGTNGTNGTPGTNGTNGQDGVDGNGTCSDCHDMSDNMVAIINQYENSVHYAGATVFENRTTCAACHTSQGFVECVGTGLDNTAAAIDNPAPINCRTCHEIHKTYTDADYALRVSSAPFKPRFDPATTEMLSMGKGTLCAKCHQPRVVTPFPTVGGADFNLTSSRYGAHNGPQATIFAGMGGFEIAGTMSYDNSAHTAGIPDGCPTCHMAKAFGKVGGGHTFSMSYVSEGEEGLNTSGCIACHSDAPALATKISETQATTQALLTQLKDRLMELNLIGANDQAIVPGMRTQIQLGAILNYKSVLMDRSLGVHNANYAQALLQNSFESLATK